MKNRTEIVVAAIATLAIGLLVVPGCGEDATSSDTNWEVSEGDGGETDYGEEEDSVVVGGVDDTTIVTGDSGDECVEIDGECYNFDEIKDEYCDDRDAQVDIIVSDGEVVDVICYPPEDGGQDIEEVETDEDGNAEVPQTDNDAVITFSEETDGEPIEGDITLDAERTSLFGNGVDDTIIDGDITVRSNQSRIRGVTVQGSVTFEQIANESKMTFCKIYEDLVIEANGVTVANCQVFGDVTVTGHDATLVNVGVQGAWEVDPSATCDGCYAFTDENEDHDVQEEEVGEELTCDGGNDQNATDANSFQVNQNPGG